jgi:hypothetical protein
MVKANHIERSTASKKFPSSPIQSAMEAVSDAMPNKTIRVVSKKRRPQKRKPNRLTACSFDRSRQKSTPSTYQHRGCHEYQATAWPGSAFARQALQQLMRSRRWSLEGPQTRGSTRVSIESAGFERNSKRWRQSRPSALRGGILCGAAGAARCDPGEIVGLTGRRRETRASPRTSTRERSSLSRLGWRDALLKRCRW